MDAIACGLPFCQNAQHEETTFSIRIRFTVIVLGSMAAIGSLTSVFLVPGSVTILWTTFAISTFAVFVSAAVKCVKTNIEEKLISEEKMTKEKLVSLWPECLQSHLRKMPFLELEKAPNTLGELRKMTHEPITLLSVGHMHGLCMKLQVRHIMVDQSYDRSTSENPAMRDLILASSEEPFSIHVLISKKSVDDRDRWSIVSENGLIRHRNGPFQTCYILWDDEFSSFVGVPLEQEMVTQFIETENQDKLPAGHQNELYWMLLRLTEKGSFQVREFDTSHFTRKLTDSVVGYWELSIAPESGDEED